MLEKLFGSTSADGNETTTAKIAGIKDSLAPPRKPKALLLAESERSDARFKREEIATALGAQYQVDRNNNVTRPSAATRAMIPAAEAADQKVRDVARILIEEQVKFAPEFRQMTAPAVAAYEGALKDLVDQLDELVGAAQGLAAFARVNNLEPHGLIARAPVTHALVRELRLMLAKP